MSLYWEGEERTRSKAWEAQLAGHIKEKTGKGLEQHGRITGRWGGETWKDLEGHSEDAEPAGAWSSGAWWPEGTKGAPPRGLWEGKRPCRPRGATGNHPPFGPTGAEPAQVS